MTKGKASHLEPKMENKFLLGIGVDKEKGSESKGVL